MGSLHFGDLALTVASALLILVVLEAALAQATSNKQLVDRGASLSAGG